MAKKFSSNQKFAMVISCFLLGTGLIIFVVYSIAPFFGKDITMPSSLQVTVSALISFGISLVWKLLGEK